MRHFYWTKWPRASFLSDSSGFLCYYHSTAAPYSLLCHMRARVVAPKHFVAPPLKYKSISRTTYRLTLIIISEYIRAVFNVVISENVHTFMYFLLNLIHDFSHCLPRKYSVFAEKFVILRLRSVAVSGRMTRPYKFSCRKKKFLGLYSSKTNSEEMKSHWLKASGSLIVISLAEGLHDSGRRTMTHFNRSLVIALRLRKSTENLNHVRR
jgi:hypothetical protein